MKRENLLGISMFLLITAFGIWLSLLLQMQAYGQPYNENATINTTVNITNSAPLVPLVTLETPITLTAYNTTTVYCNVTVYDFDNDTVTLNATIFDTTSNPLAADDQNNHYSNSSCTQIGRFDTETNFTCGFNVNFFANNGTWYCNATALDDDAATGNNVSQGATIQPLVAIVIPGIVDFGDLAQGQTSTDQIANVTNAGNRDANVSVKGYGVTEGDGLAMDCTFGSIPVGYERYNNTAGSNYNFMTPLTVNLQMIPNFYIPQRTNETADSANQTFWQLYIPTGAGGVCNGKIMFSARDRGN